MASTDQPVERPVHEHGVEPDLPGWSPPDRGAGQVSGRESILAGATGVALVGVSALMPYLHTGDAAGAGDVILYEQYSGNVVAGLIPYGDFFFEYPPVAIVGLLLPRVTWLPYAVSFRTTMLVLLALTIVLVLATLRALGADRLTTWGSAVLMGVSPALLGQVVVDRFDVWPAFLLAATILLTVVGATTAAGGAAALAACAKVYPVVAVPMILLLALHRRGWRAARRAVVAMSVTAAAVVVPFAVVGFGGLGFSFYVHFKRPLQVESLGASGLLALDRLGVLQVEVVQGLSRDLDGTLARLVAAATSVLQVAAVVAAVWWFWRGPRTPRTTVLAIVAAVAAFATFGKVLSPQYLVWLVPLVPLVPRRIWPTSVALLAAAMAMTVAYFPSRYHLVTDVTGWAWLLLARNLALVALVVVLLRELAASARATAGREPEAM